MKNFFTKLFKKKEQDDKSKFKAEFLGQFPIDHAAHNAPDSGKAFKLGALDNARKIVDDHEKAIASLVSGTGGSTGTPLGTYVGTGTAGGYAGIGGAGGLYPFGTYEPDLAKKLELERLLIEQERQQLGRVVPPSNPNTPPWKIGVLNAIFSRLLGGRHKHPDPSWELMPLLERLFPEIGSFGGLDTDEFSRYVCSEEAQYGRLFANEDFITALFGDNNLKMECEHNEDCDCNGMTVRDYAEQELRGDEPFEFLQRYMEVN